MSVASQGEGLLLAVTMREGAGEAERDQVTGAVERAAWEVSQQQAGFPVDVTFAEQDGGDWLDQQVAAVGTPSTGAASPARSPRAGP